MKTTRPTFGAFNQGGVPKIACFNKAATPLGVNFDTLIAAMQVFGPAWNPMLFPLPCWRKKLPARPSAFDLLTRLRHEIYETRDSRYDLDKVARNLGRWSYT